VFEREEEGTGRREEDISSSRKREGTGT